MELNPIVDTLDGVPEPLRPAYEQGTGADKRFFLKLAGAPHGYEPAARVKEFRDRNVGLMQWRKSVLESIGLPDEDGTPEAVKTALDTLRASGKGKKDEVDAAINAIKAQMAGEHAKATDKVTKKLSLYQQAVNRFALQAPALAALADPKIKGNPKLLMPLIERFCRVDESETEQGLDFNITVLSDDLKTPRVKNAAGDPMTLTDFLLHLRASNEYAGAFEGTGASGSGGQGSGNRSGGGGGQQIDPNLPPIERMRLARRNGIGAGTGQR